MSNKEILGKAIQKAIDGGYDEWHLTDAQTMWGVRQDHNDWLWIERLSSTLPMDIIYPEQVIFSHQFAKAFFGDYMTRIPAYSDVLLEWQHQLQRMVIAEDPIKYLGANL